MHMWILFASLLGSPVDGCTYFEIPLAQNGLVIGRSMELGDVIGNMQWRVAIHPKQSEGKLGYVSVDALGTRWLTQGLTLTTDGMNEKGLAVSANTLHVSAYESLLSEKPKVLWYEVVPFLLESFGTVKEALAGLNKVAVTGAPTIACDAGACFHWAVADASGNSAIIEFLNGKMVTKEGRKQHVGVMTNDPPMDWQLTNLDQYVNLRPDWPDSNTKIQKSLRGGVVPKPVGHGFNLNGLPGDASPASRFVRAFYLREYAVLNTPQSVASQENAIALATGLLNNVYLVKGTVAKSSLLDAYEYTPWAVVKVPGEGVFLYRTAADMTWKQISLKQLDFDSASTAQIPLSMDDLGIEDVTKLLSP